MKRLLLPAFLMALMLLPAASAQMLQPSLTVRLQPPLQPAQPPGGTLLYNGTLTFTSTYDPTTLNGIHVSIMLVQKPNWTAVIVSPSEATIVQDPLPTGFSETHTVPFQVAVKLAADAPAGASGVLDVRASSDASALRSYATGRAQALVVVAQPPSDPCLNQSAAAPAPASGNATAQSQPVTVQSVGIEPAGPAGVIGACAFAGGVAGLLLRRRLVHAK